MLSPCPSDMRSSLAVILLSLPGYGFEWPRVLKVSLRAAKARAWNRQAQSYQAVTNLGCIAVRMDYPKMPNRFFFSTTSERPAAVRAIWRIALEMGESSRARGIAEFWVRRAAA